MPYFERLPYAEMIAQAAGASPLADRLQSSAKLPILERAAMILKEESAGLPSPSGGLRLPLMAGTPEDLRGVSGPLDRDNDDGGEVVLLEPPPPVRAGQTATVVLSIVNDSDTPLSFSMVATHLVSQSGARIPANRIGISPAEAVIARSGMADVRVAVSVPEIVLPGEYSGLLLAYGQQTACAVLAINVTN